YAAAQQELIESLRRDVDERAGDNSALADRLETTLLALRDAGLRAGELQDALLPFAEMAECYDLADAGWVVDSGWCEDRKHRIVVAEFRRARAVGFGHTPDEGAPLAPDLVEDGDPDPRDPVRAGTTP